MMTWNGNEAVVTTAIPVAVVEAIGDRRHPGWMGAANAILLVMGIITEMIEVVANDTRIDIPVDARIEWMGAANVTARIIIIEWGNEAANEAQVVAWTMPVVDASPPKWMKVVAGASPRKWMIPVVDASHRKWMKVAEDASPPKWMKVAEDASPRKWMKVAADAAVETATKAKDLHPACPRLGSWRVVVFPSSITATPFLPQWVETLRSGLPIERVS